MPTNERPEWTRRPPDFILDPHSLHPDPEEARRLLRERIGAWVRRHLEERGTSGGSRAAEERKPR